MCLNAFYFSSCYFDYLAMYSAFDYFAELCSIFFAIMIRLYLVSDFSDIYTAKKIECRLNLVSSKDLLQYFDTKSLKYRCY